MSLPRSLPIYLCFVQLLLSLQTNGSDQFTFESSQNKKQLFPTIMVALLVRNKAHTLPYFLQYFEKLDYPKKRISLWIRADHNIDDSVDIVERWIKRVDDAYHLIDYESSVHDTGYVNEQGPCDWPRARMENVIRLRQEALDNARRMWADYIFLTDVDNILTNEHILLDLIRQDKTIVAPMLNATASEHYSNFWGDMDENGYYKRSTNYKEIQLRHSQGCHQVAVVHSTMLIDLRKKESTNLAYHPSPPGYKGPHDDLIIMAHSAKHHGVAMYVLNEDMYGYMQIPMEEINTLEDEEEQFLHLRLEAIVDRKPLKKLVSIVPKILDSPPSKLGFDQVYMVNLERRTDRRAMMEQLLHVLGIESHLVKAIDGKHINDSYLSELGIEMLPDFTDPYKGRPMTLGEIGCFLSHYGIWQDIVKNRYDRVLVFEDDIRFEMFFKNSLQQVLDEAKAAKIDWDLLYIGRKRLNHKLESWVEDSERLVWPHYSYWTLGYLLSQRGAQKLLAQKPLGKMVPVDEYLPIMFNRHTQEKWLKHFSPRDLVALSAQPLLVYPTHYTGQPGYFTDTEDSDVIDVSSNTHGSPETVDGSGPGARRQETATLIGPGDKAQTNTLSRNEL